MSPVYSRLVLFDIDGTLVHSGPTPHRMFKRALTLYVRLRRWSLPDEPKKRVCPDGRGRCMGLRWAPRLDMMVLDKEIDYDEEQLHAK